MSFGNKLATEDRKGKRHNITGRKSWLNEHASSADVLTIGSCKYTVNKNQAPVTAPKSKTSTKLTIPATVKVEGKSVPVTSIAPKAFKGMKKLKTVTIGKNIKKIGKNAFRDCKKLKTVTIKTSKLTSGSPNN